MRKCACFFMIFVCMGVAGWAAPPATQISLPTLTSVAQINALDNGQGNMGYLVDFEATVTFSRWDEWMLFVEDGNASVFVTLGNDQSLLPGDRVRIKGKTAGSFRPIVGDASVTFLHHGVLPKPVPVTFDDLISAHYDCVMVTVRGVIHAADMVVDKTTAAHITRFRILTEGGRFEAEVESQDRELLKSMLDAEVEVTGVVAGRFDDKMQLAGIILFIPSLSNIKILKRATLSPWSAPVTPMDKIITGYHVNNLSKRLRVHGTITYFHPGAAMVLQDGNRSVWITTHTREPFQVGDVADATGFPEIHGRVSILTDGEIQDSLVQAPVKPTPANWHQLAFWNSNSPSGHQNDLVSIEGEVETEVREATQDVYVLVSDGHQLSAIYRHPPFPIALPPMMTVPLGSRVRVTGICSRPDPDLVFNTNMEVPFDILLRSVDDISVVAQPSLLSIRNLMVLVALLLISVAVVGGRGWVLERRVRQKTAALASRIEAEAEQERHSAKLEHLRSRILEDINGSRPLAEILGNIAMMVSTSLDGIPCWCELADGAKLGDLPRDPESFRILQVNIGGRASAVVGTFCAAADPNSPPTARETEALCNGARLATLAMDTRQLYADLRHRSEFDLLTDIPNRFAMDKFLESQLQESFRNGGSLGLIYIDLDKFKPINDTYGHHVGDLYLQQVAMRMSHQLLGGDMLARLGGDEFAALVTLKHGRSDLDRVIARLESCFDEPFAVEGYSLRGAASIGFAIYPDDGATKDDLLNLADGSMYAVKESKRRGQKSPKPRPQPQL